MLAAGSYVWVAADGLDGHNCLWDLGAGRELARCPVGRSGFSADASRWFVAPHEVYARPNPYASRVKPWAGPKLTSLFFPEVSETLVFDAATGRLLAQVPSDGPVAVLDGGNALATYSYENKRITLWDIPSRTALHPALPWIAVGIAVISTGVWWRLRRGRRAASTVDSSEHSGS